MLIDIFSSFDPATNSFFNISSISFWFFNSLLIIIIHPLIWMLPNRLSWSSYLFARIIHDQSSRTFTNNLKGLSLIFTSLFIFIIFINFSGILPYMFSSTSHLLFTLSFGLPLWLALIISGALTSPSDTLANLLPGGAPSWLNPFLTLIETTRICVRPITLSFRLAANIRAGHIVLTLISVYLVFAIFKLGPLSLSILFLIQTGYSIFEFGICLIQAYIFCLLLTLYRDDHPNK